MLSLTKNEIVKIIKIDNPFLMIDGAYDIVPGLSSNAFKELKSDDWFFKSHLQSENAMPGVLQLEAMLQTLILSIYTIPGYLELTPFVVDTKAHYYKRVSSDTTLIIETEIFFNKRGIIKGKGQCKVADKVVSTSELILAIPKDVINVEIT